MQLSNIAVERVYELDKGKDQVIHLLQHMAVKEPENRFLEDHACKKDATTSSSRDAARAT